MRFTILRGLAFATGTTITHNAKTSRLIQNKTLPHMWSKYARIKVLTEAGKEYANVELKSYNSDAGGYSINGIAGRTIHPDGTIIPFTGKPFDKLIEKSQSYKETAKVFTLPDVEVGSIIEYRYELRYDDQYYFAPSWF